VCTFSYFFNEQRLRYNLSILLNIPNILELLPSPVTLGDQLRRRRLELGLHQKDVAKIIGVTTSSIWNWEHGLEPDLRYQPQIITFLGVNPSACPDDLIGQLAWY
jgi:DNA-binding XRE family transcriptional regulator